MRTRVLHVSQENRRGNHSEFISNEQPFSPAHLSIAATRRLGHESIPIAAGWRFRSMRFIETAPVPRGVLSLGLSAVPIKPSALSDQPSCVAAVFPTAKSRHFSRIEGHIISEDVFGNAS